MNHLKWKKRNKLLEKKIHGLRRLDFLPVIDFFRSYLPCFVFRSEVFSDSFYFLLSLSLWVEISNLLNEWSISTNLSMCENYFTAFGELQITEKFFLRKVEIECGDVFWTNIIFMWGLGCHQSMCTKKQDGSALKVILWVLENSLRGWMIKQDIVKIWKDNVGKNLCRRFWFIDGFAFKDKVFH